ncbi:hypothetical protein B0H14DRAFT_3850985 [Mycena olivaceomarginata]|nr:hypothetical protein B0H14DRAFT_3850985 [Mycena olivaceomarginata]
MLTTRKWPEAFQKMAFLPFTHLENVTIGDLNAIPQSAGTLQQLFSIPLSAECVWRCNFFHTAAFLPIWDHCSPNIQYIHLSCRNYSGNPLRPPSVLRPSVLKSLGLDPLNNIDDWLKDDLCPFDFSQLAVLSVRKHISLFRSPPMAPALETTQVLEFASNHSSEVVDLSLFLNLMFLRIEMGVAQNAIDPLSGITSSSRIRRIAVHFRAPSSGICRQLDFRAAGLPMSRLPTVSARNACRHLQYLGVPFSSITF